jgi:hypothetical protein
MYSAPAAAFGGVIHFAIPRVIFTARGRLAGFAFAPLVIIAAQIIGAVIGFAGQLRDAQQSWVRKRVLLERALVNRAALAFRPSGVDPSREGKT